MKRFLMFLVIAIAVVSLGLTIYYFSADNEVIYIKSSYLVVEVGDNIRANSEVNELVDFKNRSEHTTLSYQIQQPKDQEVLVHNENEGYFTAKVGGESKIVITTNNRNYSRLVVDVLVCDGSSEYPYIIKSEEDLKKIGNDEEYTTSKSYKLGNDIELTDEWTPISNYSGTFDGNYFAIKNMTITNDSLIHNSEEGVTPTATPLVETPIAITNAGFISVLETTGIVKNLTLTNVNIDCAVEYMGSFAGTNFGLIQTSEATGSIRNSLTSGSVYVGGIAGRTISDTKRAKIDRCGFEGELYLTGSQQMAGGVTGQNQSGIVSETYARLTSLSNGEAKFGGIVGLNQYTNKGTADIYDSYFYLTQKQTNTNYNNMAGVTYNNQDDSQENMVTGNYNGGVYTKSQVENLTKEGSFKSASNGYLLSSIVAGNEAVEFINKDKFITTKSADENKKPSRKWNFNSVWEIPNNVQYPVLNVFSSTGSTYIIDVSDIMTGTKIDSAQKLYDVLSDQDTTEVYEIAGNISLDPNGAGFVWGDASHPIPETFHGTIINPNGFEITSLTLNNAIENANVGLVKNLASNAVISGLIIKDVTITGEKANYVGVLAGESYGASIYNTTIQNVNVNLNCYAFGTLFGYASDVFGHGIKDVKAKYVNMANGYAIYAGGLVGINMTTITAETGAYNDVYHIDLTANFAGGVAGANGGTIEKTSSLEIIFNHPKQTELNIQNVYSGNRQVFVGGVVGVNEFTAQSSSKSKGNITDVYSSIVVLGQTGSNYKMYVGGVAGYNSSVIVRAYVTTSTFTITGSQNVFAGGITGYNSGRITNSVVDSKCSITTSVISSVGTSQSGGNYILNTDNCSIVGGLVGYDAQTSNSTPSIYQSASYMKNVTGYYAGGLVGLAFGNVEYSFCGESTKTNGGVVVHGYMAGGIAAVIAGGQVKDCYTFCQLSSAQYGGKYSNVLSAIKMEVSCMGGLTVFVLNQNTKIQGCYAVVSFKGNGVSFGSSADLTGYVCGKTINCIYQNAGSQKTSYGKQISASNLKGADGYHAFKNAIGSTEYWNLENGYPTLEGVNVRFPNSSLPNFH